MLPGAVGRFEEVGGRHKGVAAIEVVGVDDGEGAVDEVGGREHSVGGAPGLDAAFRHGETGGQAVHLLVGIVEGNLSGYARSDGLGKVLLVLLLDDEHYLGKAGLHGVVDGEVHDDVLLRIQCGNLLHAAKAAAEACCHNQKGGCVHIPFLPEIVGDYRKKHSERAGKARPLCRKSAAVAVRVVLLPAPGILAHVFNAVLRLPAQFSGCLGGIRPALGHVAAAAGLDDVGHLHAGGLLKGVHQIQHAVALTGAEIVHG